MTPIYPTYGGWGKTVHPPGRILAIARFKWQREQLIWSCAQAGIDVELNDVSGTLTCCFDGAADLMTWHWVFVQGCDGSPMDMEMMVSESEADF